MNFTNEMIEKAKTASSAEELLEMARREGIELSPAAAEEYFSFLTTGCQPLSDEELEQVAGGKGEKGGRYCKYCRKNRGSWEYLGDANGWDKRGQLHYCHKYRCLWCNNINYYDTSTGELI